MRAVLAALALGLALAGETAAAPRVLHDPWNGTPDAVVDLRTAEGTGRVGATWRVREAKIREIDFRAPGPDLKPTGAPVRTADLEPRAGGRDFDDSGWELLDPARLESRRGNGRLSFVWYRLRLTLPERIGSTQVEGSTVVFEIVVDDYAEVWVDGKLPRTLATQGGPLVAGFNAPNRVVVARNARPGQEIRIAVLGVNGPISDLPDNYVWVRSATLDVYRAGREEASRVLVGGVERVDPGLDAVVSPDAKLEKVAEGFTFIEGPVWHPDGYLLFSEPNANRIWRYDPDGALSIYRTHSGYAGADLGEYGQPGSNGLAFDAEGRLTIAEHGNRRITRLERNGTLTVIVDRHEGRRLNSPNDLVWRSDGSLWFSDPPFGLPKFFEDPRKEIPWSGVYRFKDGKTTLVTDSLSGPNGLAFSPDERQLYVDNWDPEKKVVMRWDVGEDGSVSNPVVFFDATGLPGEESLDGLKVDASGHVFVSGPGGVFVLSPRGKHLGTIRGPELAANFAFGDADGRTLYLTARGGLYRLRLRTGGRVALRPADPRFAGIFPEGTRIETIATGRTWVEGPVWRAREGDLLFSDIPENRIWRWAPGEGTRIFLERSGYRGAAPFTGREPGSNGLAIDREGRLLLCRHGDRSIARLEADGTLTTLADHFEGRRLNSPNDLLVLEDGSILFTDPPFGLPGAFHDPEREIPWSGVYRLRPDGTLVLLTKDLSAPNGITLSPDGRTLYLSNADPADPYWAAYPVLPDGSLGEGRRFGDARGWARRFPGAPDGMKADRDGTLFAAGPGGVHVFSAEGALLGSVVLGVATSNVALGPDGRTLFVTADRAVWRITRPPVVAGAGLTRAASAGH